MKNILIVGGSSGIGLALANKMQGSCQLYTASRTSDTLQEIKGTHLPYNVRTDTFQTDTFPALHGLVYCPGSINLRPFKGLKPDTFREDFELNVMGAIKTLQSLEKNLKAAQGASVVLFSTVAVQTGMPFHASVASAKGALEGLTRSLAAEWAPHIRVNCIAPSLVQTPLADKFLNNESKLLKASERHPLQRVGTPEEVAELSHFLLNDNSTWMTGQIITLDGGLGTLKT